MPLSTITNVSTEVARAMNDAAREASIPSAAPAPRPPLGVMPRRVWLEHRAQELAAALDDHLTFARQTGERPGALLLLDWTGELSAILSELHRKGDR